MERLEEAQTKSVILLSNQHLNSNRMTGKFPNLQILKRNYASLPLYKPIELYCNLPSLLCGQTMNMQSALVCNIHPCGNENQEPVMQKVGPGENPVHWLARGCVQDPATNHREHEFRRALWPSGQQPACLNSSSCCSESASPAFLILPNIYFMNYFSASIRQIQFLLLKTKNTE